MSVKIRSTTVIADTRILAAALLLMGLLVASCHRKPVQPVVPLPPPSPSPTAVEPVVSPPPPLPPPRPLTNPEPSSLPPLSPAMASYEAAEKNFNAGNYQAAVKSYEACLRLDIAQDRDRVHFRLGLAYALAGDTAQNLRESRVHLQRIATQFPNSPYRVPAELILSLQVEIEKLNGNLKEQQNRIKTLSEELQRLKAIDMQRHPSRPPH